MKRFLLLAVGLIPALCPASEIPELVFPAGVGVNIHFVTGHERELDLIKAAGFRFIRMDFGWASIERRQGVYDWSQYDVLLRNLETRDIRPVFILDYSNPLYEQTVTNENPVTHQIQQNVASPQQPESVAAFARWAAAAARHYHGRHIIWEIWNEPNIQFWSPKADAVQYATLALNTVKAMHAAEPTATVVGPASSTFPWPFLETLFKSGALEHFDAVSVHPYRNSGHPPESAAADYQKLRALMDQYAPVRRRGKIPVLSGEWGYSSFAKGVSVEKQAEFAVRQQLANVFEGVPLSIWYDWKNDGDDPNENEHNFGTVLPNLQPKPAYLAIRALTSELTGYRIDRRLRMASEQDFVLLLSNATGQKKLAAWTLGSPHSIRLRLSGKVVPPFDIVKCLGDRSQTFSKEELALALTGAPQYVSAGEAIVSEE